MKRPTDPDEEVAFHAHVGGDVDEEVAHHVRYRDFEEATTNEVTTAPVRTARDDFDEAPTTPRRRPALKP